MRPSLLLKGADHQIDLQKLVWGFLIGCGFDLRKIRRNACNGAEKASTFFTLRIGIRSTR
jgi:hypothetical protein